MKMVLYSRIDRRMFAPDNGPTGGNPSVPPTQPDDPWKKVDLDGLDDESRKAAEELKTQFATLQKEKEHNEQLARQHQSEKDRLAAELDKLRKTAAQAPNQPEPTAAERIEARLLKGGVAPETAKAQAVLLADVLASESEILKQQLGSDLGPVVGITLKNQAERAFTVVQSTDTTGAMGIPEVAQSVWNTCEQMVANGQQVDAETVKRLAGMHVYQHLEKTGANFATLQNLGQPPVNTGRPNPPQPPVINTGFNYPGANFTPRIQTTPDPTAPRHMLDSSTQAALDAVKGEWSKVVPSLRTK